MAGKDCIEGIYISVGMLGIKKRNEWAERSWNGFSKKMKGDNRATIISDQHDREG